MIPSLSDHPDYSFYGVFDGHGGKLIAERAAKDLLETIQATNEWKTNSTDVNSLKAAMRQGFVNLDLALKEVRVLCVSTAKCHQIFGKAI
jgi:serine/threonine protein phosphatase PrpC